MFIVFYGLETVNAAEEMAYNLEICCTNVHKSRKRMDEMVGSLTFEPKSNVTLNGLSRNLKLNRLID